MKDKATGSTSTLYNAEDAIVDIHAPVVANLEVIAKGPNLPKVLYMN